MRLSFLLTKHQSFSLQPEMGNKNNRILPPQCTAFLNNTTVTAPKILKNADMQTNNDSASKYLQIEHMETDNESVETKMKESFFEDRGSSLTMNDIDISVFKRAHSMKCNPPLARQLLTASCSSLWRLCIASQCFEAANNICDVNCKGDVADKSVFIEFCNIGYPSLLDDTIHLVQEHANDISRIHDEWTTRYGLPNCSVSECAKTARHYGRKQRDSLQKGQSKQSENEEDAQYTFYESVFDRVHNFVYHPYDLGLRVDASSFDVSGQDDDNKQTQSRGVTVDTLFAAKREHIKLRQKEYMTTSKGMESQNNKFILQTMVKKKGDATLMDAIFEKVTKMSGNHE